MDKKDILVIDDEPINLEILSELLHDKYNVKIAKDGIEGYNIYKKFDIDIIISDIDMPNMDGIEMVNKIREKDHNAKIIFITSHSDIDYLLKSASLKLSSYILKPIDKDKLFEVLKEAEDELENFNIVSTMILKICDEYIWDFKKLSLLNKNCEEISLTTKERKIFNFLFSNTNQVKTYDEIIYEISDDFEQTTNNSLKTMITNIRKKIPCPVIENVYGIGYIVKL